MCGKQALVYIAGGSIGWYIIKGGCFSRREGTWDTRCRNHKWTHPSFQQLNFWEFVLQIFSQNFTKMKVQGYVVVALFIVIQNKTTQLSTMNELPCAMNTVFCNQTLKEACEVELKSHISHLSLSHSLNSFNQIISKCLRVAGIHLGFCYW